MFDGRRVFLFFIAGLAIAPAAFAGMMPASLHDVGVFRPETDPQFANSPLPSDCPGVTHLDLWPGQLLPDTPVAVQQNGEIQHPQALTEGTSSLNLCLSALMGLGLCGSFHWFKKVHFGFIPEWYHDGGPLQVGHSHAVNPNTLCTIPAYCFIQPVCTAEDHLPQYHLKTAVSLWRKSQFTSTVLAPRAPPNMS